jgi:hypothetical protein
MTSSEQPKPEKVQLKGKKVTSTDNGLRTEVENPEVLKIKRK